MRKSKQSEKRWGAFIDDCLHSRTFNSSLLRIKHGVDGSLISTLVNLELVTNVSKDVFNWIGPMVMGPADKAGVFDKHRERSRKYVENRRKRLEEEAAKIAADKNFVDRSQLDPGAIFKQSNGTSQVFRLTGESAITYLKRLEEEAARMAASQNVGDGTSVASESSPKSSFGGGAAFSNQSDQIMQVSRLTEEAAITYLKSLGYEIFKVERTQL